MSAISQSSHRPSVEKIALWVLSHKGGVGKTTWSRAYVDRARASGRRVAAFDADGGNGQLAQYYGTRTDGRLDDEQDPLRGVGWFDVRADEDRDMLVNVSDSEADVVLIDMPGGTVNELAKPLGDGRNIFAVYKARGYRVVLVIVIGNVRASVRTVQEAVQSFGDSVDYVVVKNQWFGKEFRVFDGFENPQGLRRHGRGRELLRESGGREVVMERLDPVTYELLDAESTAFCSAAQNPDLTTAHVTRVNLWLNSFEDSLKGTVLAL